MFWSSPPSDSSNVLSKIMSSTSSCSSPVRLTLLTPFDRSSEVWSAASASERSMAIARFGVTRWDSAPAVALIAVCLCCCTSTGGHLALTAVFKGSLQAVNVRKGRMQKAQNGRHINVVVKPSPISANAFLVYAHDEGSFGCRPKITRNAAGRILVEAAQAAITGCHY